MTDHVAMAPLVDDSQLPNQNTENPVLRWLELFRVRADNLVWIFPGTIAETGLNALLERASQQKKMATALLNHLRNCLDKTHPQYLGGIKFVCQRFLFELIEILFFYDYCSRFAVQDLIKQGLQEDLEGIKNLENVQKETRGVVHDLAGFLASTKFYTKIFNLLWTKDLATSSKLIQEASIPLEGPLELSIQCVLSTLSPNISLDEVATKLESIFDIALLCENDQWGVFHAPKTIFISLIDKTFILGGSGQYLGTQHRKVYEDFRESNAREIGKAFKKARRDILLEMEGATQLKDLSAQISRHLSSKMEFESHDDIMKQVSVLAGKAAQVMDNGTNRTGQPFRVLPLLTKRGPCAKCRIVHQFSNPSSPESPSHIDLKFFKFPSCVEDSWELKRRLIENRSPFEGDQTHPTPETNQIELEPRERHSTI